MIEYQHKIYIMVNQGLPDMISCQPKIDPGANQLLQSMI